MKSRIQNSPKGDTQSEKRPLRKWSALLAASAYIACSATSLYAMELPPVVFPPENQFSEEKRALGKILFWDEQLSSDNTMSCGTCHITQSGGTDPRLGINPGPDGLFGTPDDIAGSPGVIDMDATAAYVNSPLFGLDVQVTGRYAPPAVMAMYAPDLFWDGRATGEFIDPQTGAVVIAEGGALESQAVGPPMSDAEMAHEARDWNQTVAKIAAARPLALASDLTPDLAAVIQSGVDYPTLFEQAFGDPTVSAARIAMAIATYERTLVPDQTPWDLAEAGDPLALTSAQQAGFEALQTSLCIVCHGGPEFTNNQFHNIGVRPIFEDQGRFNVTGSPLDRGRFKSPTLRNVGLRNRFMHNGEHTTLEQVFDFYAHRNGQAPFPANLDSLVQLPIIFSPTTQANIIDFMVNGLTDPRVANGTFPFDRPTLHTELADANPMQIETGIAGSGGFTPSMVAVIPPNIGNADFQIGIESALGGAQAWVAVSANAPVGGLVPQDELLGPITLGGSGDGEGFGTMPYPIPDDIALDGQVLYMQWIVTDPNAVGGVSTSPVARLSIFCTKHGVCISDCIADTNFDGQLNFFDISGFVNAYMSGDLSADFTDDGNLDFFDVSAFLNAFLAGCP